jgi:putative peptidoglycan lipid II flippase
MVIPRERGELHIDSNRAAPHFSSAAMTSHESSAAAANSAGDPAERVLIEVEDPLDTPRTPGQGRIETNGRSRDEDPHELGGIAASVDIPRPLRRPTALSSVLIVAGARWVGAALALATGMLSAKYFGTSVEKDCYVVAQSIPTLLATLLVGGVYTPLVVALAEAGRSGGVLGQLWYVRRCLFHLTLLLAPCVTAVLFAPQILIRIAAPGFSPSSVTLCATLLRFTILSGVATVLFSSVRALFVARFQFATPSFANLLTPLIALVVLIATVNSLGIFSLAVGPLFGSVVALSVLGFLVMGLVRSTAATGGMRGPQTAPPVHLRSFWVAFLPMTISSNVFRVNLLVDNAFASYLPSGSVTVLGFALVIVANLEMFTTLSLAEVAFSRFTSAALEGRHQLQEALWLNLRYMVLATLPISIGLLTFGLPVCRLLFQRGTFHADATREVAAILACYSLEIPFMGYVALLVRALYANRRMMAASCLSLGAISANVVLDALLVRPFGVRGIALATSFLMVLYTLALIPFARRDVSAIHGSRLPSFILRILVASVAMGSMIVVWTLGFEHFFDMGKDPQRIIEVVGGLLLAGGCYFGALRLLGVTEISDLLSRVLGGLSRGAPRPLSASRP